MDARHDPGSDEPDPYPRRLGHGTLTLLPSSPARSARVEQTIYVERESQRKIVLGKGGATIKAIGAEARKEIAEMTEQKVHLFLFVKVREGWGDDPERYRAMGIEFPKE